MDMPKDEEIEAICLGQGWAACATTALLVRVFSVGGVQREIFSLPGPVVSMAGHGEQLMVVYHRGIFSLLSFFELGLFSMFTSHWLHTLLNLFVITREFPSWCFSFSG